MAKSTGDVERQAPKSCTGVVTGKYSMKNFIPVDPGDPDLSNKIAKYILEHPRLSAHIGSPEIAWVEPLASYEDCKPLVDAVNRICSWQDIFYILYISTDPGVEFIHRDSDEHEYFWALNIPILNCNDAYTSFYEPLPGEQGIVPGVEQHAQSNVGADAGGYTLWQSHQVKEIDRMYLTQPMLFNMATIHGIHNPTNQPRVSISIRMNCDIMEKYNLMQK
jgi:hypothetical protein